MRRKMLFRFLVGMMAAVLVTTILTAGANTNRKDDFAAAEITTEATTEETTEVTTTEKAREVTTEESTAETTTEEETTEEPTTKTIIKTTIAETTTTEATTIAEITEASTNAQTTETSNKIYWGSFNLTAYAANELVQGSYGDDGHGVAMPGGYAIEGRTVAICYDRIGEYVQGIRIGYGTHIWIEGLGEYVIEDNGCGWNVIDIFYDYMPSNPPDWTADVYILT